MSKRNKYRLCIIRIIGECQETDDLIDYLFDDLDFIEIIMEVEIKLNVNIDELSNPMTAIQFKTVKDLIDYLINNTKQK